MFNQSTCEGVVPLDTPCVIWCGTAMGGRGPSGAIPGEDVALGPDWGAALGPGGASPDGGGGFSDMDQAPGATG